MKKIMLAAIAVVSCLILLAQIDDELNSEVQRFLNLTNHNQTSEAYLYLLGVDANVSERPEIIGWQRLKEYRKQELDKNHTSAKSAGSKLPLPTGVPFCHFRERECIEQLFEDDLNFDELNAEHAVLISRIQQFHEFTEYSTLTKPLLSEQYPPYQYLSAGARIETLNAISAHRQGESKAAILQLQLQLSKLRQSLGLHDNLIGKMVLLIRFSDALEVLARISFESGIKIKQMGKLTRQEKNFSQIAAREISGAYWLYQELDRNPEFFAIDGNAPGWMIRMLFKPNMSINAMAPFYSRLERIAQLTPASFAKELDETVIDELESSFFRNYAGAALSGLHPNFDEYVARFMDVDAKLVLVNNLHKKLAETDNPYYPGEYPDVFSDKVCVRGALEDEKSIRCLSIKI